MKPVGWFFSLGALVLAACQPGESARATVSEQPAGPVAATFKGGSVSVEDVAREANRLPPELREKFESAYGRHEFTSSLVDKRLLVAEARRRGLDAAPELRRQVQELEDRLLIQALLAEEQRAAGRPPEAELRAWFEEHKGELELPERVHVGRILAAVPHAATAGDRARAKSRAEEFLRRLNRGEAFARVQQQGDGPERARDGDFGVHTLNDFGDRRLALAAFALERPGQLSPVTETDSGFVVLKLFERKPSRLPPFEEVRAEVEGRMQPSRQRRQFDELRRRLRSEADVRIAGTSQQ